MPARNRFSATGQLSNLLLDASLDGPVVRAVAGNEFLDEAWQGFGAQGVGGELGAAANCVSGHGQLISSQGQGTPRVDPSLLDANVTEGTVNRGGTHV